MKRTTFWGIDENDEHLAAEIIAGLKTCTCYPAEWYERQDEDEKYKAGDQVAVYSKLGKHLCTIEITEQYNIPFGEVDECIVKGEVCKSIEHFRETHHTAWDAEFAKDGKTLDNETLINVEHFRHIASKIRNNF